jgi:hypothetical protein
MLCFQREIVCIWGIAEVLSPRITLGAKKSKIRKVRHLRKVSKSNKFAYMRFANLRTAHLCS